MNEPVRLEVVCFNGQSGLGDYSASLAQAVSISAKVGVTTSAPLESKFAIAGVSTWTPFRRVRHYAMDIAKFIIGVLRSRPRALLFQSWLYFPLFEGLMVRLFKRFGNLLLVTVHDTMPHHPKPWSRISMAFFYRGFDGLIAHSASSMRDLRALGVKAPIAVIPHATYDDFNTRRLASPEARSELGIGADCFVVLFFGHIDERKGCFEFLEAAQKCSTLDKVLFLMAGRNDLGAKARLRFDRYRNLSNIRIVEGHVPREQVQSYFAASDLIATPYLEGTTSGVFRLAMAFGKPVVTTEIGDLKEAVARGSAFSIGVGNNVGERLATFVKDHHEDLQTVASEVTARATIDAASSTWSYAAAKYMDFLQTVEARRR